VSPYNENARTAFDERPVHALRESRVRDDELAAVEYRVTHEPVDEPLDRVAELNGSSASCSSDSREPMADRHVATGERALELVLVVAGNADRPATGHEVHDKSQDRGLAGPRSTRSPRKIASRPSGCKASCRPRSPPTENSQELDVSTRWQPMDVADDVGNGRSAVAAIRSTGVPVLTLRSRRSRPRREGW
jgi:hypothetical protein